MSKSFSGVKTILAAISLTALGACSSTGSSLPAETHDGLTLVANTQFQEVYRKQGADLTSFTEFGLAPCNVAFKKNWLRNQNSNRIDLSSRLTQKDVDRIKDSLSEACDEQFEAALLQSPPYTLVKEFDNGEPVLIIRPSIINLDINAPDVRSATMSRSYTTSSGEMTLSLELVDATTGEVLARAVDKRRGMDDHHLTWTSSVTNRADANRTLKRWAVILREALDETRGL